MNCTDVSCEGLLHFSSIKLLLKITMYFTSYYYFTPTIHIIYTDVAVSILLIGMLIILVAAIVSTPIDILLTEILREFRSKW